ncbi:hypothetical protein POF50_001275 [Streptomyces sp. SL13]|uniref:Uncharacterized protein n=1 Tax=Streptantibioticus silvisoli TaxID=2705255 RepID=A0AA90KEN3_9ACTN|nr:DUF6624 domain-containing protein [Streptantibioticus silvisoli]MDI5967994.1 hypothetical protein [Streptantibioticus silvisoli]
MSIPPSTKNSGDVSAVSPLDGTPPARLDIANDLLRCAKLAQTVRSIPDSERTEEQRAELRRTNRTNTEALRRIVADHGWPSVTLVGLDAGRAAWLIALRCDDAEFQNGVLPLLADAVAADEAESAWWAHIYDRCCALTGVKQWFGTQFRNGPDSIEMYPVDDPEKLDARRAEYGLRPHPEKTAELRQRYGRDAA